MQMGTRGWDFVGGGREINRRSLGGLDGYVKGDTEVMIDTEGKATRARHSTGTGSERGGILRLALAEFGSRRNFKLEVEDLDLSTTVLECCRWTVEGDGDNGYQNRLLAGGNPFAMRRVTMFEVMLENYVDDAEGKEHKS